MKTSIGFWLLIIAATFIARGGDKIPATELHFNQNGRFKIAQFTDVHFQYDSQRSDSALEMIKTVLVNEKPDLAVLTGDIVCSKDTRKAWLSLSQVLVNAKIPWAVVFGNHDPEYELTKSQILETIVGLPYNLTINGPSDVAGNGNYILKIQSSSKPKTAALLYFLDSHSGLHPKSELGGYQWIDFSQITWYRNQSLELTKVNGGAPLPALMFMHIPLPEYKEAINTPTSVGFQRESVCSPELNSGLYTALIELKDVMGVFAGHDHDNNYIGCLHNICLGYGNVSGRQCYGSIGRGARIIELYEGDRKFDTWILKLYECDRDKDIWTRTGDDKPQFFVTYPDSFESGRRRRG